MDIEKIAEHSLMNEVIMPFLRENWALIDQPEPGSNKGDGRLTYDELTAAYQLALMKERPLDAWVIGKILNRYERICQAHEDGYWWKEEPVLGISEQDISVYQQSLDGIRVGGVARSKPSPKKWM